MLNPIYLSAALGLLGIAITNGQNSSGALTYDFFRFVSGTQRGWELLAKGILKMTNVSSEIVEPYWEDVRRALQKLWDSTRVPEELTRSISRVQFTADQAAMHSAYSGYDPDLNAALAFIEECEAGPGRAGQNLQFNRSITIPRVPLRVAAPFIKKYA